MKMYHLLTQEQNLTLLELPLSRVKSTHPLSVKSVSLACILLPQLYDD